MILYYRRRDTVEVHYCMVKMQWKFVSFKHSINFDRVQNVSIRRSSSAVIYKT